MKRVSPIYLWTIVAWSIVFFHSFATDTTQTTRPASKEKELHTINVDMVEFILKYRIILLKMLYGTPQPDGSVEGLYVCGERPYGIHVLALSEKYAEQNNINKDTLTSTLLEANKDFIEKTTYFLTFAKKLNVHVFEEIFFRVICIKVFEMQKQSISFQYLELLIMDILAALNKLIESSPKATAQCYERAAKWQKIKKIIDELQQEGLLEESFDKLEFLRFIKNNYLDVFLLGEFSKDQVEIILQEYTAHS